MRSYFHRSPTGCFSCSHSYEYAFHTENGDSAHLWLRGELSLAFSKENICFVYQWPCSFLSQLPSKCSTDQTVGLLKVKGCTVTHSTLLMGLKRKIQELRALTASLARDQHGKVYWLALVSKVLFPWGVSCPEQDPGWIQMKGMQGRSCCKPSTMWHKSAKDSAVLKLPW